VIPYRGTETDPARRVSQLNHFIHGVPLTDPHGLPQRDRLSKRFLPIETDADAERPEVAMLIDEAAALDPAECARP